MKFLPSNQISKSQFFFFMIHSQVGLTILSLPHILGKTAGHDGWISLLISATYVQMLILIYYFIIKNYPELTFYDITIKVFGSFIGKCINVIMIVYYVMYSVHFAYQTTSILKLWNYYRTPFWFMFLLLILVGFYILNGDLATIGRFLTIAVMVILLMIYFLFWDLKELNYHYLLPVGESNIWEIFKASKDELIAFTGFEIFLFIHPFVCAPKKKVFKIANISIWLVCLLYLTATTFVFMYFPNAAKNIVDAVIYFIIPMHFTILERIEVFFIAAWTVLMTTSYICFLYIGCLGMSRLRNKDHHNYYLKWLTLIIFVISIIVHKFANKQFFISFAYFRDYYSLFVIILIPTLTAILLLFKRTRTKQKGSSANEA